MLLSNINVPSVIPSALLRMPLLNINLENICLEENKHVIQSLDVEYSMRKSDTGGWECLHCNFKAIQKCHVVQHVESKHVMMQYQCNLCAVTCPTKNALQKHRSRKHNTLQL